MLVNNNSSNDNVKFISYTGSYPNLCSGVLTLEIDGKVVKFGHNLYPYNKENEFEAFWRSGGTIENDGDWHMWAMCGEWDIDVDELPDKYRKYAAEIDEVFNENVPYGCCGGCI